MLRFVVCGGMALLASCDDYDRERQERFQSDAAIYARIDRLEDRITKLEATARAPAALPAQAAPPTKLNTAARLIGSTARGEPISETFSSMTACNDARAAIIAEGLSACTGHDQNDSTASIIYGICSKPQASCSRR